MWRLKGRCVRCWKIFSKGAINNREEAKELIAKKKSINSLKKADSWYAKCVLGKIIVEWSSVVKLEIDKRKFEESHEKRRNRAKLLLSRIKKRQQEVEVVVEEGEEGEGDNDNRIHELQTLIEKCLDNRDLLPPVPHPIPTPTPTPTPTPSDVSIVSTLTQKSTRSKAVPKSVTEMFERHKQRAQRRAALSDRYKTLNEEKELKAKNYSRAQLEKIDLDAAAEKKSKLEKKEFDERKKEAEKQQLAKRRDMWKLAKMHSMLSTLRNHGFNGFISVIRTLRLKEKKADNFCNDGVKVSER